MRLIAYGIMVNAVVHYEANKTDEKSEKKEDIYTPGKLAIAAKDLAINEKSKVLLIIPFQFFVEHDQQRYGAAICVGLGLLTTLLLLVLESA